MRNEEPHYEQWERETHRQHVDFSKRTEDEQRDYWQWRALH